MIRWGVLGAANIAIKQVIPAMRDCTLGRVTAIASRDPQRAIRTATELNIPVAYGSYEELLASDQIDAVYIPLPNHLHLPWSIQAIEAGKHVLCEKPVALNAAQARELLACANAHPHIKVMEAFMYRFHPQWERTREIVRRGGIGALETIQTLFSYNNLDPANVRNIPSMGGGALLDIGCYGISLARFIFDDEPVSVLAHMEIDPRFHIDHLVSAVLTFPAGTAGFTCATQQPRHQRVTIVGTDGHVEIEVPFNAPIDRPSRIWHQHDDKTHEIFFAICNQYTLQADRFARAILDNTPVPTPLADAVANMRVIDAVVASANADAWVPTATI